MHYSNFIRIKLMYKLWARTTHHLQKSIETNKNLSDNQIRKMQDARQLAYRRMVYWRDLHNRVIAKKYIDHALIMSNDVSWYTIIRNILTI